MINAVGTLEMDQPIQGQGVPTTQPSDRRLR